MSGGQWSRYPDQWLYDSGVPVRPANARQFVRELVKGDPRFSLGEIRHLLSALLQHPVRASAARELAMTRGQWVRAAAVGLAIGITSAVIHTALLVNGPMPAVVFAALVAACTCVLVGIIFGCWIDQDTVWAYLHPLIWLVLTIASTAWLDHMERQEMIWGVTMAGGVLVGLLGAYVVAIGWAVGAVIIRRTPVEVLRKTHGLDYALVTLQGLLAGSAAPGDTRDAEAWNRRMLWGIEEFARTMEQLLPDISSDNIDTSRRRAEAVARRVEAVRRWKDDVLLLGRGTAFPTLNGRIRTALLHTTTENWGALAEASTATLPIRTRDVGAAAVNAIVVIGVGVAVTHLLVLFSERTPTLGVIAPLFRSVVPFMLLVWFWAMLPESIRRWALTIIASVRQLKP